MRESNEKGKRNFNDDVKIRKGGNEKRSKGEDERNDGFRRIYERWSGNEKRRYLWNIEDKGWDYGI